MSKERDLFFHLADRLDSRVRLVLACVIGVLVFYLLPSAIAWQTRIVAAWDTGIICFLFFAWTLLFNATPHETEKSVTTQDQSGLMILSLVMIGSIVSLFAIALMLHIPKSLGFIPFVSHILLSIGAILLAWLLVHTMFTFHYAHKYYRNGTVAATEKKNRGLMFPNDKDPDYMDFVYFSFVIGMTSQVSDVQISSKSMRRLALFHGIISFGFNVMILALSINITASLI